MEEANKHPGVTSIFLKYLLLVVPFLSLAWLLQKAAAPLWNNSGAAAALPGVIQGLIWFVLVFLIVKAVEKRQFHWADFGLGRKACKPALIFLGILLAILLYLAYLLTGHALNPASPVLPQTPAIPAGKGLFTFLFFLSNGFGEEMAFRGFLQSRLIARFTPIPGILLTAALFVPLHFLVQPMSLLTLLSGLLLWSAIGALYYLTGSLYQAGLLHTVLNSLPVILGTQTAPAAGLVVHSAVVLIIFLVLLRVLGLEKKKNASLGS